jgi:esterase/lipase superfamily enzyme
MLVVCRSTGAQAALDLRLSIPPTSEARSPVFELAATEQLTIRLDQPPVANDGTVRVYIFDHAGVLSALDDPEMASDRFAWQPPDEGRYFVKAINTNSSPVSLRIVSVPRRALVGRSAREFGTVRIFFATNRQPRPDRSEPFGSDPAEMSYGYCDVSIPRDHRMGELEAPSLWRLEIREDRAKHVVLTAVERRTAKMFFSEIADRVSQSLKKEALVFVHGFNVTFNDAAKRTAQIAYDLAFDGAVIAFSWPSQGALSPLAYTKDQRNADLSAQRLEELLLELKGTSAQLTLHLVAHSMGNRVLARALERMGAEIQRPRRPALEEVAMMAPDIDAQLFRQASGTIAASARHVTLYASSADLALKAAQRIAGYPRAGEAGDGLVVVPGIETVDASSVETSMLGLSHAYYSDNATILSDLFALIRGRRPSDRFGLRVIETPAGTYWQFKPAVR